MIPAAEINKIENKYYVMIDTLQVGRGSYLDCSKLKNELNGDDKKRAERFTFFTETMAL